MFLISLLSSLNLAARVRSLRTCAWFGSIPSFYCRVSELWLIAQSLAVSEKALLGYSHTHSFMDCLWLLLFYNGRTKKTLNCLLSGPLQRTLLTSAVYCCSGGRKEGRTKVGDERREGLGERV